MAFELQYKARRDLYLAIVARQPVVGIRKCRDAFQTWALPRRTKRTSLARACSAMVHSVKSTQTLPFA
eukprot:COSAG02_NODE_55_length_43887_cov_30.660364_42_plen_68_part_00